MIKANGIPLTAPALKLIFEDPLLHQEIEAAWPSSFICTEVAAMVFTTLGAEHTKMFGFSVEGNPEAVFFSEGPEDDPEEGHHFAVVADRFIVDPWVYSVFYQGQPLQRAIFDTQDARDRSMISYFYGDPEKWVHLLSEQSHAERWPEAFPAVDAMIRRHLSAKIKPVSVSPEVVAADDF